MIKRVSEAILNTPNASDYKELVAKNAIRAMREPTDYQRNKYYELSFNTTVFNDGDWQRAIDSILK